MYGPVSKNGPALEFGEIGEEVKDEVRRQATGEAVERARGKLKARDEREDDPFLGVAGIKNTFVELRKDWIPAREWSTD